MDSILTSIGLVALAEMGDKTQLLAILLAAKYRKPMPIILGILVATLLNHLAAATLGYALSQWLSGLWFRLIVGAGFLLMAGWALVPDKSGEATAQRSGGSVMLATAITFFLVEIGDKTQIATSLLAARFHAILPVAIGTTIGMMLANVPAVLLGERVTRLVPLKLMRLATAALFAGLGLWIVIDALLSFRS
jgi:putative Ca2+/H+ antiporter (TMEM165/GDT1 family)